MGGPKKLAPYLVFANEKRDAAKELLLSEGAEKPSMGEIAKRVGVMWGQLDDAGKVDGVVPSPSLPSQLCT